MIIWLPGNLPSTTLRDRNRKLMLAFLPDNIPLRSVIKKQGFPRTLQVPHDQLRSYDALMAGLSVEENRASATESGYTNCSPNRNTWRSDGRTRSASGTWKRQPVSGRNYPRSSPPRFGKTRVYTRLLIDGIRGLALTLGAVQKTRIARQSLFFSPRGGFAKLRA